MSLIGPEGRKQLELAARFMAVGFELAVAITVGYLGGRYLDHKFGAGQILRFTGLILGIAAGFRGLIVTAKTAQQNAERNDSTEARQPPKDPPSQ
jgi:F0F1-type ATP synthase assembly protein I